MLINKGWKSTFLVKSPVYKILNHIVLNNPRYLDRFPILSSTIQNNQTKYTENPNWPHGGEKSTLELKSCLVLICGALVRTLHSALKSKKSSFFFIYVIFWTSGLRAAAEWRNFVLQNIDFSLHTFVIIITLLYSLTIEKFLMYPSAHVPHFAQNFIKNCSIVKQ